MTKVVFYTCEKCANTIEAVRSSGKAMVCCGEEMREMIPKADAPGGEKHSPVVKVSGNTVKVSVGSIAHPMTAEHGIEWICLETDVGSHRIELSAGRAPEATFVLDGEVPRAVYAYCNLHGLWKA